ncbi:MAG TPA: hypothetical protein DD490_18125 [Acidobacteria bacterium]|nr:hypothetical protein [Acidobacteriota bacterium]
MQKQKMGTQRVLARRLAKELSAEQLATLGGRGTSYGGTGGCIDGKARDIEARDCCNGSDVFVC